MSGIGKGSSINTDADTQAKPSTWMLVSSTSPGSIRILRRFSVQTRVKEGERRRQGPELGRECGLRQTLGELKSRCADLLVQTCMPTLRCLFILFLCFFPLNTDTLFSRSPKLSQQDKPWACSTG